MLITRLIEGTLNLFRGKEKRPSKRDFVLLQSDVALLQDTLNVVLQSLSNQNAAARENRRLLAIIEQRSESIREEVMSELADRLGGTHTATKPAQSPRIVD